MSGLYTASRIFVGFMGFVALGGTLFFAGALSSAIATAGTVLGIVSLMAAAIPQRKLSSPPVRGTLLLLCAVGIAASFVLLSDNLGRTSGIEWDVVSMNVWHIAALATMTIIALKRWRVIGGRP